MLNLGRQQTSIFLIMTAIIIVLSGILYINSGDKGLVELGDEESGPYNSDRTDEGVYRSGEDVNSPGVEEPPDTIKIYITGQVKSPGVVEIEEGCRLIDAIQLAGGLTDEADSQRINLAMKVEDEGMYIIPKIGEEIEEGSLLEAGNMSQDRSKVNINRASVDQLQTLHGIGPAKANAIIEYRESQGTFKDIEDIKKVTGIGAKTFERLKDSITVR